MTFYYDYIVCFVSIYFRFIVMKEIYPCKVIYIFDIIATQHFHIGKFNTI